MCFTIDKKAKRWEQRVVFKVVEVVTDGYGDDIIRGPHRPSYQYVIGRRNTVKDHGPWRQTKNGEWHACTGIYVFATREDAESWARYEFSDLRVLRVMRCTVAPRSFKYASKDTNMVGAATYACVTPFGRLLKVRRGF